MDNKEKQVINMPKDTLLPFELIQSSVDGFFKSDRKYMNLIPTGFKALDEILGGGLANGLNVLGAKPGSGKTSIVLQMAENFSSSGVPVIYFSLEMSRFQINAKALNRNLWRTLDETNDLKKLRLFEKVSSRDFIFSDISKDKEKFGFLKKFQKKANERLSNFYVVEPGGNFDGPVFRGTIAEIKDIIESFMHFCEDKKLKQPVAVIDYLQIVSSGKEYATERQNVDAVIHELFDLKTKIPIILISALNRSSYTGDKKQENNQVTNTVDMGSFKESGNIEFSAEVLIGMQDITGDDLAEPRNISLKLLKHRYGQPNREVVLSYHRQHDLFTEKGGSMNQAMGISDREIEEIKLNEALLQEYKNAVGKLIRRRWNS